MACILPTEVEVIFDYKIEKIKIIECFTIAQLIRHHGNGRYNLVEEINLFFNLRTIHIMIN
jgi:hypothetical protein